MTDDKKEMEILKPYPPLGLLYLSAWLEKYEVPHDVYDTTFRDRTSHRKYLEENQPDILGIYSNLITKPEIVHLIKFIKSNKNLQNTMIVLGGPDITYNIEPYLDVGADILVIGEGEQTFLEIIQNFKNGKIENIGEIQGIAYKLEDNQISKTHPRQKLKMDALPFPNRHKIDIHQYLDLWKKSHGKNSISVSTQRGCPYTCKWCSTAVYGQSYRRMPANKVADELSHIVHVYHPDLIWFVDDVFTVSHVWLENFRDELRHRNIKIQYECITRADRLNAEVIKILKETGCYRVWIGAESGSQTILDAMDRRVDAIQVQKMILEAKDQGIQTGTFIMLGYPGETEDDILKTLDHLKNANPDIFTITTAYPIKGTALYNETQSTHTRVSWESSTDREIDFARMYPKAYYAYASHYISNKMKLYNLQRSETNKLALSIKLSVKILLFRSAMYYYRFRPSLF